MFVLSFHNLVLLGHVWTSSFKDTTFFKIKIKHVFGSEIPSIVTCNFLNFLFELNLYHFVKVNESSTSFMLVFKKEYPHYAAIVINDSKKIVFMSEWGCFILSVYITMHKIKTLVRFSGANMERQSRKFCFNAWITNNVWISRNILNKIKMTKFRIEAYPNFLCQVP